MATNTTRPAETGGIDISGIDVADAIFKATGGGYGAPQGGGTDDALLGAPGSTGDWITRDGRTPDGTDPADTFDLSTLVDPKRNIMLTTDDPNSDNPWSAWMKPEETPDFANGGPEGVAFCMSSPPSRSSAASLPAPPIWRAPSMTIPPTTWSRRRRTC